MGLAVGLCAAVAPASALFDNGACPPGYRYPAQVSSTSNGFKVTMCDAILRDR